MLSIGNKETSVVYIGRKAISAVYLGSKLIWEAVSSCFGSGGWRNEQGWSNYDGWAN